MANLVRNRDGMLVDPETGVVVEDTVLDTGPEWRAYTSEERNTRSRAGSNLNILEHDYGVTTVIGAGGDRVRAAKLAALNRVIRASEEPKLIEALRQVYSLCEKAGLTRQWCEEAARVARRGVRLLYRRVNGFQVTLRDVVNAAILYAAARAGLPVTDVVATLGLSRVEYRRLLRLTPVIVGGYSRDVDRSVARTISLLVSRLGLDDAVAGLALRLYAAVKQRLQGTGARSLAAMLVYVAGKLLGYDITQPEVADVVGISEATIRATLKRSGLRVKYNITCIGVVYEWRYGVDTIGLRSSFEVCRMYGVSCGRPDPRAIAVRGGVVEVRLDCGQR